MKKWTGLCRLSNWVLAEWNRALVDGPSSSASFPSLHSNGMFLIRQRECGNSCFLKREYSTDSSNNKNSGPPQTPSSSPSCSSTQEKLVLTSSPATPKLSVRFEHGLPTLVVPLPSRKENCQFTLRPVSDNVGTLCENLIKEDNGIEIVALYNSDGTRISKSTNIQHLLRFGDFRLRINDTYYEVELPVEKHEIGISGHECLESEERLATLDDLKAKVSSLYAIFNVDDFKIEREKLLLKRLEEVEMELRPMEMIRKRIDEECQKYSQKILWMGFLALGLQTGVFARLTWWEYSWDIVEPVTYFATFSTVFATVGYYLLTNQNFEYSSAHRRVFTNEFYKRAKTYKFDMQRYNVLGELSTELRYDLKRLRDPLQQHLPIDRLASMDSENSKLWCGNQSQPKTNKNSGHSWPYNPSSSESENKQKR